MKTKKVSIASAAVLLIAGGIGFGIAQAGRADSEAPVLNFEDQEALANVASACPYEESQPVLSFEDQVRVGEGIGTAAIDEDRPVLSFEDREAVQLAMVKQRAESCRY